jgi:hypothetical protein
MHGQEHRAGDPQRPGARVRQIGWVSVRLDPILLRTHPVEPGRVQLLYVKSARHEVVPAERLGHAAQPSWCHLIIDVAEQHGVTGGHTGTHIERMCRSPPVGRIHHPQTGQAPRELADDLEGAIGRAIVGDDDLPLPRPLLGGERLQLPADAVRPVEARKDDAHLHDGRTEAGWS